MPFQITEADIVNKPEINVKENSNTKKVIASGSRDLLYNPKDRNNPNDRYTIAAIIKYLERKKFSITSSYEQWYKVAMMAISNSFTYEIGEKYFLKLSALDKEKYNEMNCRNFLLNCYETRSGAITFSTIIYFANQKGYTTKKQRERGFEVVDENLSQVSSSNTVTNVHLPEDLKK
jgi:hypothetical protein